MVIVLRVLRGEGLQGSRTTLKDAQLGIDFSQLGFLFSCAVLGISFDLCTLLEQSQLANRDQLVVAGSIERSPLQTGQDFFFFRITGGAISHEEVVDLVFHAFIKVLAPNDRIRRDQWRLPDYLNVFDFLGMSSFQTTQVFSVVSSYIDLLVSSCQQVSLMIRV